MKFLRLIQPADFLELTKSRQGPRGVACQGLERAQINTSGIERLMRSDLKSPQYHIAYKRHHDLAPNPRQGHGVAIAPRIGPRVWNDDWAALSDNGGQDVLSID